MATSDLCNELSRLEDAAAEVTMAGTGGGGGAGASAASSSVAARSVSAAPVLDATLQSLLGRTLLHLLDDPSADVQSVAVKAMALLSRRLQPDQLSAVLDRLVALVADREKKESRDIYAIGLKTIIHTIASAHRQTAGVTGAENLSVTVSAPLPPSTATAAASAEALNLGVSMAQRILSGLLHGLQQSVISGEDESDDLESTLIDLVREVLMRFGPFVPALHAPLLQELSPRLESGQAAVRKRAVATLATLVSGMMDDTFARFMDVMMGQLSRHEAASRAAADAKQSKNASMLLYTYLQLLGLVSQSAGARIATYLPQIVPQLTKFLENGSTAVTSDGSGSGSVSGLDVLVEVWEGSLLAFETLLQRCPQALAPFLANILKLAEQHMAWDPNYFYPEEEEEEAAEKDEQQQDTSMAEAQSRNAATHTGGRGDDDDWGEDGADDGWGDAGEDDGMVAELEEDADEAPTWKVRRAAVKVIAAFIRSRSMLAGSTAASSASDPLSQHYAHLCDLLLSRFKERDRLVKIAVLEAMQDLLKESAPSANQQQQAQSATSHEMMVQTSQPSTYNTARALTPQLESRVPTIVNACLKQLKQSISPSAVDASTGASGASNADIAHQLFLILCQLLWLRGGGLESYLPKFVPLLLTTVTSSQHSKDHALKIDALTLLRACIELHAPHSWFGSASAPNQQAPSQLQHIVQALVESFEATPYMRFRSEIMQTVSSLLLLLGPFKQQQKQHPHPLYSSIVTPSMLSSLYTRLVYSTLCQHDIDQQSKEYVLVTISHFFFYFGSELQQITNQEALYACMKIVTQQRLPSELTRMASLRYLARIARAPKEEGLQICAYVFTSQSSMSAMGGTPSTTAMGSGVAVRTVLDDLLSFYRKDQQQMKLEVTNTLIALLANLAEQNGGVPPTPTSQSLLTQTQFSTLLREASAHLSDADLSLSHALLQLFTSVCQLFPALLLHSTDEIAVADADMLLSKLQLFIRSPLLQSQSVEHICILFRTIMRSNANATQSNPHLTFQYLFDLFMGSVTGGNVNLGNLAQIVGSGLLLPSPQQLQSRILQQLVEMVHSKAGATAASSSEAHRQFALLLIGEVGRHADLATIHPSMTVQLFFDVFANDAEPETIRMAASVALGNVCMGNIAQYLPMLLERIEELHPATTSESSMDTSSTPSPTTNGNGKDRMLLLLNALNQLIRNLTIQQHRQSQQQAPVSSALSTFRSFLPKLLPLLWHACSFEESVRSVVSELLGGLVLLDCVRNPIVFPELVARLSSDQPNMRAVVVTALRHALVQQQQQQQTTSTGVQGQQSGVTQAAPITTQPIGGLSTDLLQQHLPAFLALLRDHDLSVRRQAILTLSSLAHSRHSSVLLMDQFHSSILPVLYAALSPDPSLVRVVDMGPFKHKVDDGLPLRKAAFQCLDTVLDVAFPALDSVTFLRHLSKGLTDHPDIVILVYGMLAKVAQRYPNQLAQVLDEMPPPMMDGIKTQLKLAKTAAPVDASSSGSTSGAASADQSIAARAQDVLRAAVRSLYTIQSMPTVGSCTQFIELYQRVLKTQMLARMLDEMQNS